MKEPRPSSNCHRCLEVDMCECSCHLSDNVMGVHYCYNSLPEKLTGLTKEKFAAQLRKRNGNKRRKA